MNLLDLFIIIFLGFAAYRWYKLGFVQGLFSLLGLILGVVLGIIIAPWAMGQFVSDTVKFIIMILIVGGCTALLAGTGEHLGHKLHIKLIETKLRIPNMIAGAVFSVFVVLGLIWVTASLLANSPFKALNKQIQGSFTIHLLNSRLPATPSIISKINGLLAPLDFPQVFVGAPPKLSSPVAPAGSTFVRLAVENTGESTVRIEAVGCGEISTGSGFIVREDLVMTNAHVVAGSTVIEIVDTQARHRAELVYFDPTVDIAILRTEKLGSQVLNISEQSYERGQEVAVLGFPGGGDFHAEPAGITRLLDARGYDIYNTKIVERNIYELRAHVVRGNSGGPVVLSDGTVIGMIFASAQNEQGYGYALTGQEIRRALNRVELNKVSSQRCQAD